MEAKKAFFGVETENGPHLSQGGYIMREARHDIQTRYVGDRMRGYWGGVVEWGKVVGGGKGGEHGVPEYRERFRRGRSARYHLEFLVNLETGECAVSMGTWSPIGGPTRRHGRKSLPRRVLKDLPRPGRDGAFDFSAADPKHHLAETNPPTSRIRQAPYTCTTKGPQWGKKSIPTP